MLFPVGQHQRVFDRPDSVARNCKHMPNEIMEEICSNVEEIFGQEEVGIEASLKLKMRNTPYLHIFLFLED